LYSVSIEPVAEDVIPVSPRGFRLIEPEGGYGGTIEVGRNFMGRAGEILYRQSRRNIDLDIEGIIGCFALGKIGVLYPSF
jgi:hypothetical protein